MLGCIVASVLISLHDLPVHFIITVIHTVYLAWRLGSRVCYLLDYSQLNPFNPLTNEFSQQSHDTPLTE